MHEKNQRDRQTIPLRRFLYLSVLIVLTYQIGTAQRPNDKKRELFRCEMALVTSQKESPKILGEYFFFNSVGEEGTISRRLPGSKLYVVGRSFLDDYFGLVLELSVSINPRGNKENSRNYAFSGSNERSSVGRLAMSIPNGKRKRTVSMICVLPEED